MANFVYNMYMHMIQSTRHYQQVRSFYLLESVYLKKKLVFSKWHEMLLRFETVPVMFKTQGFMVGSENIEVFKILQ